MKILVLVPELTFAGQTLEAGDTFTVSEDDRSAVKAVAKLIRIAYVAEIAEDEPVPAGLVPEATELPKPGPKPGPKPKED